MIEGIIVIILIIVLIIYYRKLHYYKMVYIKSDIDNNKYLVRDLEDKYKAANILAKIKKNILTLTKHLVENIDKFPENKEYIKQLEKKIKNVNIQESSDNGVYTSYSVNKGEQIIFCIRSRKENNKLHDLNMLMYVVIHEMGHVGCPEFGHTQLFKDIFAFFLTEGIKINIYNKIDFRNNNMEYCGMQITDSII